MNPFSVKTPETLKAEDIASLFIDVYSDFPRLLAQEHTFLHGARGTGKSMMLRYLEPQVQVAAKKVSSARELSHYAIHVPIKSPNYALSELERLDGSPYWLLAEHFMICNVVLKVMGSLGLIASVLNDDKLEALEAFYCGCRTIFESCGSEINVNEDLASVQGYMDAISRVLKSERNNAKRYMANLAFNKEFQPYENALYGYEEFFLPFIRLIKSLDFTPNGPIYLMVDDADNLPVRMQKILNTWVSYRTTNDVCMKVSTQQRYKTWRTTQDVLIERAHDFSEIDISAVYTSKHSSHYYDRVQSIVRRRLEVNHISNSDPLKFFPENLVQREKLDGVKRAISEKWESGSGVSSRKSDDVTRYAVSDYMKELAKSKKTNTFSYSGFKSLVDISSGMIRYFLEPASRMYAEIVASGNIQITEIPANIQDQVIYRWSEEYVLEEFDRLRQDEASGYDHSINRIERLRNLINALGQCFQRKLLSDDSERRFLSFMVTKPLTPDVQNVVDLATEWGYLSIKSIARKEGVGRNLLYTLNRRLAPYFKLDPSGYAAHMSLTPEHLKLAVEDPQAFVRERLKRSVYSGEFEDNQQLLDLEGL
ncbi:MAG: hypothetical protein JMN24_15815 [gamma proteobacterium endosymbiont of Lamellibrachia anaximandri]|nr:hypothetical protein [gamma proteobacterium endosymbiont of Lamellibrachia anaximandri]MBL3619044.1 hypothetical protein [gamma proteobacterium endosymbiont of Lamellibrachia anaximandri]